MPTAAPPSPPPPPSPPRPPPPLPPLLAPLALSSPPPRPPPPRGPASAWRRLLAPLALSSLFAGGLAGCASQLPPPNDADALRASAQWPGTTVAALARGRTAYADHCSACHAPYPPTK